MSRNIFVLFLFFLIGSLIADEGMWTYDNLPLKDLKEKYGFVPTKEWLDNVRLSSVRFMDGGSGSFVSPDGLILTNHHVAVGQLQKLSNAKRNYVKTGFYAKTKEEEIKCPDLEINILVDMKNITDKILSVLKPDMTFEERLKAKKEKITEIENKAKKETGLEPEVVNLYHDGEFWLYLYKKYTDVRLVFAPERQAAYFGGDYDNFTYPRYDLDFALFRAYENGKPVKCKNYLKWNSNGIKEGDLVFVSGHPGSTDRLYTYNQLKYLRDYRYPYAIDFINHKLKVLEEFAQRGPEQARKALIYQFGLGNGLKAMTGEYKGLRDSILMNEKKKQEEELKNKVYSDEKLKKLYGDGWSIIDSALDLQIKNFKRLRYHSTGFSRLLGIALNIVRYVEEIEKPDKDRLEGYHESELDRLKFRLLSPAPIYKDLEEFNLADDLKQMKKNLDENDEFLKAFLGDNDPEKFAHYLISKTKLDNVDFRKKMLNGGKKAVKKSKDPLIKLALKIDPILRKEKEFYRNNIESRLRYGAEKIAKARFAIYGKSIYPDATFTLRLSYGTVKGYPYNGTIAPAYTTLYGLFDRALSFKGKREYSLPERFWQKKDSLDLSTPVNFVSTCDIIGGNSGSPVVNREGEIVGLIFDGNIESLYGRFLYDEKANRAVAVHTAYIIEALRKIYNADNIADELENR